MTCNEAVRDQSHQVRDAHFGVDTPTRGEHIVSLAGGAVVDLQGTPVAPLSLTVIVGQQYAHGQASRSASAVSSTMREPLPGTESTVMAPPE